MKRFQSVKAYYEAHPLKTILLVALTLRLVAAFFGKGYAFHDDHFCVTRVAQNWVSGFPHWVEQAEPPKHSMFYAAINAGIIWTVEAAGSSDQMVKTTAMRLFHAFYSLLVVFFTYKIVQLLTVNRKIVLRATWIMAVLWFMPYLSVKFLAELVCVPPVMAGFYLMIKASSQEKSRFWPWLIGGMLFGVAFAIRLHTILFAGGLGLVLLFERRWVSSIMFSVGFLLMAVLIIGITDMIFFDYPFHSVVTYFIHNSENANNYIQGSPFKFTLTTLGFLVPPISVLLLFGYLRSFRWQPMIFVAVAVFFVFHSAFPNQQERFILPTYPLIVILGTIGWITFADKSLFWQKNKRLLTYFWGFFWIINIVAGLGMSLTYSKKDRIEPLYYLSKKDDVQSVIIENERSVKQVPAYYLGSYCADYKQFGLGLLGVESFKATKGYLDPAYKMTFTLDPNKSLPQLQSEMDEMGKKANYVVFQGNTELEARKERLLVLYPNSHLVLEKVVQPSNLDKLLHFFNPRIHRNQEAAIYKIVANP